VKWLLLVLPLLGGCGAMKSKTHVWGCIGACVHAEQDIDKGKGEDPKVPAPADDAT